MHFNDWAVEKENKNAFPTFEKHLRTVLEWKADPKKFIKDLLDNPKDTDLYEAIKDKLSAGNDKTARIEVMKR